MFVKSEVFEDFNGFLHCHENNYSNTGGEVEPKITGEVINKSVLNTLYTFNLLFDVCVEIATDGCTIKLLEKYRAVSTS